MSFYPSITLLRFRAFSGIAFQPFLPHLCILNFGTGSCFRCTKLRSMGPTSSWSAFINISEERFHDLHHHLFFVTRIDGWKYIISPTTVIGQTTFVCTCSFALAVCLRNTNLTKLCSSKFLLQIRSSSVCL
jgi:hypothetical protein